MAVADVIKEAKIDASPETIFPFLTDETQIVRWFGTEASLDARPGGTFSVLVSGKHRALGEFVEIVPNERVVFTFGWEGGADVPPGSSTVEITLERDGQHTIVRLVHRGLPNDEEATEHTKGWDHYVGRLVVAVDGGDPGPDGHLPGVLHQPGPEGDPDPPGRGPRHLRPGQGPRLQDHLPRVAELRRQQPEPAEQRRIARRPGQGFCRQEVRPEATDPHDHDVADLPAQRPAE